MLDKRLKLCADMVSGEGIVCDVGTDHAYLPVELILSGKCEKVIASDINEHPLDAAARTIKKYGVSDKISLVLSDGLENVPLDGVSDIIIAGMGGETIIGILDKIERSYKEKCRFVLQPMTKPEVLRSWLVSDGFEIIAERIAETDNKMYTVINASWTGKCDYISESESISGFFDDSEPLAEKYYALQTERLERIRDSLEKSGKHREAVHYNSLCYQIKEDWDYIKIEDIYNFLDSKYPFSTQEKWDNSGWLVEAAEHCCHRILLTLDITKETVYEAIEKGAEVIISHHPVIFEPLRKLEIDNVAAFLVSEEITAICMHTNLDKSPNGTNGVILRKLAERFEFDGEPEIFEDTGDGLGFGYVCNLSEPIKPKDFGKILKEIFGCEVVRYNNFDCNIRRFAFCSGSGGSMLDEAIKKKCNAYITGDVKHDVWIDANNRNMLLFDCGHFHTENLVLDELRYVLEERFPELDVIIAESSVDPVKYIVGE